MRIIFDIYCVETKVSNCSWNLAYERMVPNTQCDKNARLVRESQPKRTHKHIYTRTNLIVNNDCTLQSRKHTFSLTYSESWSSTWCCRSKTLVLSPNSLRTSFFACALTPSLALVSIHCTVHCLIFKTMYMCDTYLNLRVRFILVPTKFGIPFSRDGLNVKIFTHHHSTRLSSKEQINE